MKITFIIKDLSDIFYNGGGVLCTIGLLQMTDSDKFIYLRKLASEKVLKVTCKVGNCDSFRDKVELNSILRGEHTIDFKLEDRRGYKLATFNANSK